MIGCKTAKGAELANEMSLVGIAGFQSEVTPIGMLGAVDLRQHGLEATQSGEAFVIDADLAGKEFTQSPRAPWLKMHPNDGGLLAGIDHLTTTMQAGEKGTFSASIRFAVVAITAQFAIREIDDDLLASGRQHPIKSVTGWWAFANPKFFDHTDERC